jgi:RHS repeat-associated protein
VNPIRYRGYYFDSEINLYYLQSRYYNSAWGRFISADVYMDTQDGILGTNMYAYCQNDPVNFVDPSGMDRATPWWKKIGLNFPGEIHKVVIADIIANNPGITPEVTISLKGKTNFRIDLRRGKEIWEVKPANTMWTDWLVKGGKQLQSYIDRAKDAINPQTFVKGSVIPGNTIYYFNSLMSFEVKYWYSGDGIIQYTYERIDINSEFVNDVVWVTLVGCELVGLASFILTGLGDPTINIPVRT